jgi:hypothetical protein
VPIEDLHEAHEIRQRPDVERGSVDVIVTYKLDRLSRSARSPTTDRLDGIAATACGLLLDAWKGFAFVVNCTQAKEFTLAHCW